MLRKTQFPHFQKHDNEIFSVLLQRNHSLFHRLERQSDTLSLRRKKRINPNSETLLNHNLDLETIFKGLESPLLNDAFHSLQILRQTSCSLFIHIYLLFKF
jgi:hypothetical protein